MTANANAHALAELDAAFEQHLTEGGAHDSHALYDELRAVCPVYRTPAGFWFLTSYEHTDEYFRRDRNFGSPWTKEASHANESSALGSLTTGEGYTAKFFSNELHHRDGEAHARLRKLLSPAFSPKLINSMRPSIRSTIDGLLDELVDNGGAELISDYAIQIPTRVILEILGIPLEHSALMEGIARSVIASHEPGYREEWLRSSDRAFEQGHEVLLELAEQRRRRPTNDLLSNMANARGDDGDVLSDVELTMNALFLVVAGYETTAHSIGSGVYELLQHPEQLALLREDPELISSAVEEILRYHPAAQLSSPRWALDDMEMGGQKIRRGDEVKASILAANHDPKQFPDPHVFDIRRTPNRHLAFGLGSAHFCLGALLARIELQEAISALFDRIPEVELAGEPRWRDSLVVHGLTHLPLRW